MCEKRGRETYVSRQTIERSLKILFQLKLSHKTIYLGYVGDLRVWDDMEFYRTEFSYVLDQHFRKETA
jgi:hypothetical protein